MSKGRPDPRIRYSTEGADRSRSTITGNVNNTRGRSRSNLRISGVGQVANVNDVDDPMTGPVHQASTSSVNDLMTGVVNQQTSTSQIVLSGYTPEQANEIARQRILYATWINTLYSQGYGTSAPQSANPFVGPAPTLQSSNSAFVPTQAGQGVNTSYTPQQTSQNGNSSSLPAPVPQNVSTSWNHPAYQIMRVAELALDPSVKEKLLAFATGFLMQPATQATAANATALLVLRAAESAMDQVTRQQLLAHALSLLSKQ